MEPVVCWIRQSSATMAPQQPPSHTHTRHTHVCISMTAGGELRAEVARRSRAIFTPWIQFMHVMHPSASAIYLSRLSTVPMHDWVRSVADDREKHPSKIQCASAVCHMRSLAFSHARGRGGGLLLAYYVVGATNQPMPRLSRRVKQQTNKSWACVLGPRTGGGGRSWYAW